MGPLADAPAGRATVSPTATPIAHESPTPTPVPPWWLGTPMPQGAVGAPGLTGDCDGNGRVTINELIIGVSIALGRRALSDCPSFDINGDARVAINELIRAVNVALNPPPPPTPTVPPAGGLTVLSSTSPVDGEGGVAVTRETILRFSAPLDSGSVHAASIVARFGGNDLAVRLNLSRDRTTVTLFYPSPLPPTALVRVTVDGDLLRDDDGIAVDADRDGRAGGLDFIEFETLALASLPGTAVCGRVFASELGRGDNGMSVNVPLGGVRISVDGMEGDIFAVTDERGDFRLEGVPVGEFFVHVDGRTATDGVPEGAYYPFVGKSWRSEPGIETNIGEIFLPLVTAGTLRQVSLTDDTVIEFPEPVRSAFPELEGVRVTVPPDSLFRDDGARGGMVGIAPVPPDRLPGPLPPGLAFPLVITVQTDGATNFDEPAPVCFPNLPDAATGQPLPPGAESALWSFNHDTGRFEIVGPMRVTADGKLVCSEPGVGILAPGWHGTAPGAAGGGGPIGGPAAADDMEKGGGSPPGAPSQEGCPPDDVDDSVVDPVYLFSGEFYEEVEDLRIPGRGMDFVWARKYRSKIGPDTAQGNGWDYSYNIFIESEGADLVVCDGNSRRDTYTIRPLLSGRANAATTSQAVVLTGRTYTHPEYQRELHSQEDASLTLAFADGGRWDFFPLDGSAAQGKIRAIVDRNGNTIRLAYDALGRLATISDTLDRDISIAYDDDGFIAALTDFTGREVRYEYYRDGDAGGGHGDLRSVRSPLVTDTPNGNDFPKGKFVTYTYSTGFADERLNHNLLTITDGRRNDSNDPTFGDGPYLRNVYAATQDPTDLHFDRVVRQAWGNANDVIDLVYVPLTPDKSNGGAYMKTILNDRVGNVKEYFFEPGNRVVLRREYTGRADPDKPTSPTVNRPSAKLRAGDPPFFETRYEWNDHSLLTRIVHPNGNTTEYLYEGDVAGDSSVLSRANLRTIRRGAGSLEPSSDQTVIEEHFEYDPRFGCPNCSASFVTRHTDGRGNATLHDYDERGNRIRTRERIATVVDEWEFNAFGQMTAHILPDNGSGHRRRDEYRYYDSGPQRGYRRERSVDAGGLALTTTYEYDAVGNLVRRTDGRGHDTTYDVNQLNQVVRVTSRQVRDDTSTRYRFDRFYDANDNVVRVDTLNVEADGTTAANSLLTTTYEYEILNRLLRKTAEVDPEHSIVVEYEHDANRNLTLVRHGEATNGNQPENTTRMQYDERDLLLRRTHAPGTLAQSSSEYEYDANGNIHTVRKGLEGVAQVTSGEHDGFDRVVEITDPMGNVTSRRYDGAGNLISTRIDGELDDAPGGTGNVRLSEMSFTYDAMDRPVVQEEAFFALGTQESIDDGVVTKRVVFSDTSQVLRVIDDNGNEWRQSYDTANRLNRSEDPKGNTLFLEYDANSNVTRVTQTDKSDLGAADEIFVTTHVFDNLNRRISRTDNLAHTRSYGYDSRNNNTVYVDARGNVIRSVYDGLDRLVEMTREMTDSGEGGGAAVGRVTTTQVWDDSSRLLERIDDGGNATRYGYDDLGRMITIEHADGTQIAYALDVHGNRIGITDANGTRLRNRYDQLNRLTRRSITRGAGVEGAAEETYGFDGRSRLVRAVDEDSTVLRDFDSLSNVIRETQNGQSTVSVYDGEQNQLSVTYPGGREVSNVYDGLNRKQAISDADGLIAEYAFIGSLRVQRRDFGNATRTVYRHDGGRRIVGTTTTLAPHAGTDAFDEHAYAWDPESNKIRRDDLFEEERSRTYVYDSLNRLVESSGGESIAYELDSVENRLSVSGGAGAGDYVLSANRPEPADRQVNQYTSTPFDDRVYDANGNLTSVEPSSGGAVSVAYDYRNQMIRYQDAARGGLSRYAYDALGRRIAKVVEGVSGSTTRYFYDGWRVVEEQNAAGETLATFVYGRYLDEVLQMQRAGTSYYYHADDLHSVTAVSDAAGSVVERYRYGDYGQPTITDAAGSRRAASAIGNPYLFTGRRYDDESGLYYYRTRYLDPRAGRFTTRDPIGIWADTLNRGNALAYAGSNPLSNLDPTGLTGLEAASSAVADVFLGGGGGAAIETGAGAAASTAAGLDNAPAAAAAATEGGGSAATVVAEAAATIGGGTVAAVGAVVALGAFAIVDAVLFDDAMVQTALDYYFAPDGADMPDPWANQDTEIDQEPIPEIDQDPIPDPNEGPEWDEDAPEGPGAGGDAEPGEQEAPQAEEDCEEGEEPNEPCPEGARTATGYSRVGMSDSCASARNTALDGIPPRCIKGCTERRRPRLGFPWQCEVTCRFGN